MRLVWYTGHMADDRKRLTVLELLAQVDHHTTAKDVVDGLERIAAAERDRLDKLLAQQEEA